MVVCIASVIPVASTRLRSLTSSVRSSLRLRSLASPRSTRPQRRGCKNLTVAYSSVLLPDVSPEANVPPAVVKAIEEFARNMPTWEVFLRASVEITASVLIAFVVVKAIQKTSDRAIHVSSILLALLYVKGCWQTKSLNLPACATFIHAPT